MEQAKFVRVAHNGKSHLVALYAGLDPQELCSLLQAAFRLRQYVVGLVDPRPGIVVPISLACKAPQLLGGDIYSLILSGRQVSWERIYSSPAPSFTSSHNGATAEVREEVNEEKQDDDSGDKDEDSGDEDEDSGDEDEDSGDEDEDTDDDIIKVDDDVRIVAFVRRMAGDGMVDEEGGNALESAAARGDSVVHTAFAAAVRSQDLDYLAALLKDIAVNNRRNNSTGRRLLEAKRIMLGMAESFRQAEEVDDDQLAFLQNLILVSNDDVMAAFRTYEQMQNPAYLAESLRKLCGARQSVKDSQTADDHGADSAFASAASRNMRVKLLKVAINLACRGVIGAFEAKVVRKMISQENGVLTAAFKVYQEDDNMAELRDTVARAARIEAKRVIGESPSRRAIGESPSRRAIANPNTMGITRTSTCPSPLPSDGAPSREFSFLLEGVLRQGVINLSDARILFAAFEGRPIESGSANLSVLSNMVHGAWRMFKSSRDKQEVTELLCRIVRLSGNPAPSTTQDPSHSEAHVNSGIVSRSVDHLLATKKVSLEEASCLASPSPAGRRVVFNALGVFQRDSSRETLLASLTIIAKAEKANRQETETASQPLGRPQATSYDPTDGLGLDAPRAEQQTMDEEMSLERAKMELMELVEHMSEEKSVSVEEAQRLTSYIKKGHPRVFAVYKEHVDSQSLIDALVSMVRRSGERAEGEEESVGTEQRLWERVAMLMRETNVLDASDAVRLLGLLSKKDPRTVEAFQAFDSSKDVSSLVSSVNAILNEAPAVSASTNLNAESLKPAAASPRAGDDMSKTVLEMVEEMRLNEQQVVALRRAISSGDANVDGAMMVFKLDSDAEELKDTLARVARNAVERQNHVLPSRGEGSDDVHQGPKDDDEATTFMTVLQHLRSVGGSTETQMDTIVRRYHEKDPLLLAALDVYKEEHDLSELVDTIKRLTRVTF